MWFEEIVDGLMDDGQISLKIAYIEHFQEKFHIRTKDTKQTKQNGHNNMNNPQRYL